MDVLDSYCEYYPNRVQSGTLYVGVYSVHDALPLICYFLERRGAAKVIHLGLNSSIMVQHCLHRKYSRSIKD